MASSVKDLDTLQGGSSLGVVEELQEEVGCPFAQYIK